MSYLNQPRLFFSGKFHADPSTVNNTPDNYNPNANFPPANGESTGNNIQLYWNPNGSGKFALDCTVTQMCDDQGNVVDDHPLLGMPLVTTGGQTLAGAKLVDLDPMQQNVTELWGLSLSLGPVDGESVLLGHCRPSAYSNAWIQVIDGRGDYAGSVQYQSVIELDEASLQNRPDLLELLAGQSSFEGANKKLSIAFVVRAFNSSSLNYLINDGTMLAMNKAGVPTDVSNKLLPITLYNTTEYGTGTPGQIPTTSYFEKLVNGLLTTDESSQYLDQIKAAAILAYQPKTEFDFTYGQVFGVIGVDLANEPPFMSANRMLTPQAALMTSLPADPARPQVQAPTVSASYAGYFAPFTVNQEGSVVTVNLGNSLLSSQPASQTNSYVATDVMGQLFLCYFDGEVNLDNAIELAEIDYQSNDFYLNQAGLANIAIDPDDFGSVLGCPLGIISSTDNEVSILLHENVEGYYLRANQFVFRMNPGQPTTASTPRGQTQQVEIYVRQFGHPVVDADISITLMSSIESQIYSDNTLGTGSTSGLVNMGVPTTALDFPSVVTTDAQGVARFTLTASDPGNPRGYVDGQIYFLQYGFADAEVSAHYVNAPDNIISVQVYSQQPDFADITWDNFVQGVLGQYGKLYPVMGFLDLQSEQSVIDNAQKIYEFLNFDYEQPQVMPVTRDLSSSRLDLLNRWLLQQFNPKKSAFGKKSAFAKNSAFAK